MVINSKVKIPVNADGKLDITDEHLKAAPYTKASLLANSFTIQALVCLGGQDLTAKKTSPAAFLQIQKAISEVWAKDSILEEQSDSSWIIAEHGVHQR